MARAVLKAGLGLIWKQRIERLGDCLRTGPYAREKKLAQRRKRARTWPDAVQ
jgi:hypothetical protein